ncbi:neprilysin-like [Haemaphysalis longicornis]
MALILCAVVAMLMVFFWSKATVCHNCDFCNSDDCQRHEALISANLNRSIDPCYDFSAYVCSAWQASSTYRSGSPSSQQDIVDAWAKDFESILRKGQAHAREGERALRMLNFCTETSARNLTDDVRALRNFMSDRKMRWPGQPIPDSQPLGVLLDLDFNWGVGLWFRVRFLRKPGGGNYSLAISPTRRVPDWLKVYERLVSNGMFYGYWRKYYELLASREEVNATLDLSNRTAHMQISVLRELGNAGYESTPSLTEVVVKNISFYTPNIPPEEWTSLLNENLKVDHVFTGEDCIIVTPATLLAALNNIFATFKKEEILETIAWFFVQEVAPIIDPNLVSPVYVKTVAEGGLPASLEQRVAFCKAQVEGAYRPLIISLYTVSNFPAEQREDINTILREIRKVAVTKLNAITWLDSESKRLASEKLNASILDLWPPEDLLGNTALTIMHQAFPNKTRSFAVFWMEARKSVRDLFNDYKYQEALDMQANLALPLVDYDYLLNSVRISVQTMTPPVFYAHGTLAMFYGGLGYLYASHLMRALDTVGLRITTTGDMSGLWLSSTWRHAVFDGDKCFGENQSYFPEIPALEVTYAALEQALVQSKNRQQRLPDGFSERQMFFVTMCFIMCSRQGTQPNGDCNKAVMNFRPFAEEFHCPHNSRMKPRKQCSFFGENV